MTRPPEQDDRRDLYRGAAWGLLALLAGLLLAWWLLPEWRTDFTLTDGAARQRYRDLAVRAGLRPVPGEERVTALGGYYFQAYRALGEMGDEWLAATHTPVLLEVSHEVRQPESENARRFEVRFSPLGVPHGLCWGRWDNDRDESARFEAMARLLLEPGELLGPPHRKPGEDTVRFAVTGSRAPTYLVASSGPCLVEVVRRVDAPGLVQGHESALGSALLFLGVVVLFLVFALRARLSVVNGLLLALAAVLSVDFTHLSKLPSSLPVELPPQVTWIFYLGVLMGAGPTLPAILLAWPVGESLLRLVRPETVTDMDELRQGRLRRRTGRALLSGFGWGLALAGFRLGLLALAIPIPGVSPDSLSVILPPSSLTSGALGESLVLAAWMSLVVALAVRLLPARWAVWAAAVAGGGLLELLRFTHLSYYSFIPVTPWPVSLCVNVVLAGVLSYVTLRFGLAGLLASASSYLLVPTALLASRAISWWPVSFTLTAAVPLAILVLGWRGATRAGEPGPRRVWQPAFLARLEEERHMREMDLLARIQAGLLPREMPRVEGWDLSARSVLAQEAGGDLYDFLPDGEGRLWIAAGDVAGHGPSCAIALAMTKAALATLVTASRSPAEVLRRVDQVLRSGSANRRFTTLALLRLDPRTGEAVLANAAHPYPLLAADGGVSELELPGLPLGQGPRREYREISFQVPSGGVLAFVSDGLLEAMDASGTPYGFDAAKDVLQSSAGRSAGEIVETLMAAWRHHLGSRPTDDDTTVVIVKRLDAERG
ncbi:MAG TPA: PP2C family protein-serine/threonine phosphatase [Thermoanaerobaculia bacterium]|nr:PP2C family protein-serine/threonine phosphatase [Thermoanaerobaculia bacterium]